MPHQLALRVLPQLLLQRLIPRPRTPPTLHAHGHIIRAILQLPLVHRRAPRLIQRATHRALKMAGQKRANEAIQPDPHLEKRIRAQVVEQISQNDTGVQRDRSDLRVVRRKGARVQDVGEFRGAVAAPGVYVCERGLVEHEAVGCGHAVARTAQRDDAHVCAGLLRRLQHGREQLLREQRVAHVICAELDFVALLGGRVRGPHYARVVDEHVEAGFARLEGVGGGGDGGEGGEVEGQVDNLAGVGDLGFDVCDGGFGFGCCAGGEVDSCWGVRGEVGYCLLA